MTPAIAFVLLVTGLAVMLFITEWLPMDQVALGVPVALLLGGVLDVGEVLSGFAHPATLAVASFLVLGMAAEKSGLMHTLGQLAARMPLRRPSARLAAFCLLVASISPFLSNTAVVVAFLPVFVSLARSSQEPASRYLIPLSFSAILGGTVTLIGTSTNLVVHNLAVGQGLDQLSIFSITPLGLIYLVVGMTYMFTVGRKLLPVRNAGDALSQKVSSRRFTTELTVTPRSRVVGLTPEKLDWEERYGLTRVKKVKTPRAWYQVLPTQRGPLEAGDILSVTGDAHGIFRCARNERLQTPLAGKLDPRLRPDDLRVVELMLAPHSRLTGRTVREIEFGSRFGAVVLGVQPVRRPVGGRMNRERLAGGDLLLIQGPPAALHRLADDPAFVPIGEHVPDARPRGSGLVTGVILSAVVAVAALDLLPIVGAAFLGAAATVFTRCVRLQEIYRELDWSVITLLVGLLPLGLALDTSGAARWLASGMAVVLQDAGPTVAVLGFYLVTSVLTEVMSNQAASVVFTPIAISTATTLGHNPYALVVAVMFGASASFMTPVGYQTNTLVYAPGGYRFVDYIKVGGPLNLLMAGVAGFCIPRMWP